MDKSYIIFFLFNISFVTPLYIIILLETKNLIYIIVIKMVLKDFIKQNNIKKLWVPNSKPDIYYKIKINNFVQNDHIVR